MKPIWASVRLGPDAARARLRAAGQVHAFEAPTATPTLVWIAVDAAGVLSAEDVPGAAVALPVPASSAFMPHHPARGEIRRRAGAERYAPYWVFGAGEATAIVDAVNGELSGHVALAPGAGTRQLIGLTIALLIAIVVGLEILDALLSIGLLFPLSIIFPGTAVSSSLALIMAGAGALYWFGRRSLTVTRPLLAEAADRARTDRVDLARVFARPTVIWAVGWLALFVALRMVTTLLSDEPRISKVFYLAAAGVCGLIWRVTARYGARPKTPSPWIGADGETGAPVRVQWAYLTLRIAIFGVSAWWLSRIFEMTDVAIRSGLWVFDVGPGVANHVVAAGVALGMWTGERRFKRRARTEALTAALAPESPTQTTQTTFASWRGPTSEEPLERPIALPVGRPAPSTLPVGRPAPSTPPPNTEEPPTELPPEHAPGAAPVVQLNLTNRTLLAGLVGTQLGAILAPGVAILGLGVGSGAALWTARRQLSPRERWAALGATIAGAGLGQWIGAVIGTVLVGAGGMDAGAEIGEWTVASAALAALLHSVMDRAPVTGTPGR